MKPVVFKRVPRKPVGKAQSWEAILKTYRERIERYEPMLNLIEKLAVSPVAKELFPHTSMAALVITDDEQFYFNDNLLSINYNPKTREFDFEHRTLSGKNDKRTCSEAEALQTLSLFLKYKFGVLFDPKASFQEKQTK
jgi:hypothetical protein